MNMYMLVFTTRQRVTTLLRRLRSDKHLTAMPYPDPSDSVTDGQLPPAAEI